MSEQEQAAEAAPKARKGSKVNVGVRSKADDQKEIENQIAKAEAAGLEVVVEDGMKFLVERGEGITIKTRIE